MQTASKAVICGKGIAFKKKPGDEVNESAVNKVFVIQDEIQNQRFRELVAEIPLEHLQLATEILDMIKTELEKAE